MLYHRFLKIIIGLGILFLIPSLAKSELIFMELRDGEKISDVKTINRQLTDKELTLAGAIAGKSKLADIIKQHKMGTIFHEGDAGGSLYSVCYIGNDDVTTVFESHGEMGGSDHTITYIGVFKNSSQYSMSHKCSKSVVDGNTMWKGRIRIGMTKKSIKKISEVPSKVTSNRTIFIYDFFKKTKKSSYDISSTLDLKFVNDELIHFSISKIESN